jgi:hypothetical protein
MWYFIFVWGGGLKKLKWNNVDLRKAQHKSKQQIKQ